MILWTKTNGRQSTLIEVSAKFLRYCRRCFKISEIEWGQCSQWCNTRATTKKAKYKDKQNDQYIWIF